MTLKEALKGGVSRLRKAGVDFPELDAELLLADAVFYSRHSAIRANRRMKRVGDRVWLFAHPEYELKVVQWSDYRRAITRRARREPVAYILGHKEFYGLDFLVDRQVLIPRPESELLVEQAIHECKIKNVKCKIIDVGTGSGVIAVAVAKECKIENVKCKIFGTDISRAALRVARKNARRHGVEKQIKFLCGNLLQPLLLFTPYPLPTHLVIIANLPYLPTSEWRATAPEIKKWEPRNALDGGKDGLKYYREMFGQLKGANYESVANLRISNSQIRKFESHSQFAPMAILCEICPHQVTPFKKMVREYFNRARFKVVKDLTGRARVVSVKI